MVKGDTGRSKGDQGNPETGSNSKPMRDFEKPRQLENTLPADTPLPDSKLLARFRAHESERTKALEQTPEAPPESVGGSSPERIKRKALPKPFSSVGPKALSRIKEDVPLDRQDSRSSRLDAMGVDLTTVGAVRWEEPHDDPQSFNKDKGKEADKITSRAEVSPAIAKRHGELTAQIDELATKQKELTREMKGIEVRSEERSQWESWLETRYDSLAQRTDALAERERKCDEMRTELSSTKEDQLSKRQNLQNSGLSHIQDRMADLGRKQREDLTKLTTKWRDWKNSEPGSQRPFEFKPNQDLEGALNEELGLILEQEARLGADKAELDTRNREYFEQKEAIRKQESTNKEEMASVSAQLNVKRDQLRDLLKHQDVPEGYEERLKYYNAWLQELAQERRNLKQEQESIRRQLAGKGSAAAGEREQEIADLQRQQKTNEGKIASNNTRYRDLYNERFEWETNHRPVDAETQSLYGEQFRVATSSPDTTAQAPLRVETNLPQQPGQADMSPVSPDE